ncbi:MAG: hypothetical protein AAFX03_01010 [Pseudomonadota bacterium]
MREIPRFTPVACLAFAATPASAQSLSGVFSPDVRPGSKAAEYRMAFTPSDDGDPDAFAARLHYQQSVTDNLRLRGIVVGEENDDGAFAFDSVQFEAQWQFREDDIHGYDSALRFDFEVGARGVPHEVNLNWTNQIFLGGPWFLRAIATADVEYGDDSDPGVEFGTRFGLNRRLGGGYRAEIQMFNSYGSTADFPGFDDQRHVVGPAITGPIGDSPWSFQASTLFGFSEAAADLDARLFIIRSF